MSILTINSPSNHHDDNVSTMADEPMNPSDTMVLLGKFTVDTWLFESVESHFEEIYPFLLAQAEYTSVDLIGEPLWTGLTELAQRQAIHCLQHLATLDDVPLTDVSCPGCGTTSFEIIS